MLVPDLREKVGKAVYVVWCELDMLQGEAAIRAYIESLPVPLEVPRGVS